MRARVRWGWVASAGLLACSAQAALVDIGGGIVLEPGRHLMWLQDWNMAAGSVHDDGSSGIDGRISWASAQAWAGNLVYGGHDDWRLPTTAQPDPSCSNQYDAPLPSGGTARIYFLWGCQASELGHFFHQVLGGRPHESVLDPTGDSPEQQANLALLRNLQTYDYWSQALPSWSSEAWSFGFQDGRQFPAETWHGLHVVAVRDVPEPPLPAMVLLALAAAALAGQNRKYFCAIGSTVAGSQVNSTPSARTW